MFRKKDRELNDIVALCWWWAEVDEESEDLQEEAGLAVEGESGQAGWGRAHGAQACPEGD